jgi:hypothetical protein
MGKMPDPIPLLATPRYSANANNKVKAVPTGIAHQLPEGRHMRSQTEN